MENLTEKLYRFISEQSNPITIGTICSNEMFSGFSRREIGAALLQLQRQRALQRTIEDGKACYIAASGGRSVNPIREELDAMQAYFDSVSASSQNPGANSLADAIMAQLFGSFGSGGDDEN